MKFNVAPRYTAGSPALVDETTAVEVARSERHWYGLLLENPGMAPADTEKAKQLGLRGIVYTYHLSGRFIHVEDMLTGEHFRVPEKVWPPYWYKAEDTEQWKVCRRCGWRTGYAAREGLYCSAHAEEAREAGEKLEELEELRAKAKSPAEQRVYAAAQERVKLDYHLTWWEEEALREGRVPF